MIRLPHMPLAWMVPCRPKWLGFKGRLNQGPAFFLFMSPKMCNWIEAQVPVSISSLSVSQHFSHGESNFPTLVFGVPPPRLDLVLPENSVKCSFSTSSNKCKFVFWSETLLKAAWACQYYSHWKIGPVSIPWNLLWETNIWPFHRKWRWSTQLWVRVVKCEIFHQSAMLCLDFPISSTNLWIWRFFGMDRFLPVPIRWCASPRPLRRCLLPTSCFLG